MTDREKTQTLNNLRAFTDTYVMCMVRTVSLRNLKVDQFSDQKVCFKICSFSLNLYPFD